MAKATRIEVPPAVPVIEIKLTMSAEEAKALASVLLKVGGHPTLTRRGLTQNVLFALEEVGVHGSSDDLSGKFAGFLYFTEVK